MQNFRVGKKSKLFSPESDFTEQIFTGERSRVDSAGVLRQGVKSVAVPWPWYTNVRFLRPMSSGMSKVDLTNDVDFKKHTMGSSSSYPVTLLEEKFWDP